MGLAAAAAIVAAVFLISRRDSDGPERFAGGELAGTELAAAAPPGRSPSSRTVPDSGASSRPPICPHSTVAASTRPGSGVRRAAIPIGTFSEGNGDWVTLWSGASPVDYPTLSVTIEAPDGNQESSGQRVLVGETSLLPGSARSERGEDVV